MTLRSPIAAMLWENWRITRAEVAWRLLFGIVTGLGVLTLFAAAAPNRTIRDFGAVVALILIVMPAFTGWMSIPRSNGLRPGFPFSFNYTRPVRTAVIVGVPMAYLVAMAMASYLGSALLLRVASGYPFPLLPVAAWIAVLSLLQMTTTWASPKKSVTILGTMVTTVGWMALVSHRLNSQSAFRAWNTSPNEWPTIFHVPLTDYGLVAALGLAAFSVTVAGVARQRRGDDGAIPSKGFSVSEWLGSLFRVACPTVSATRAQLWFELKSRGLLVLAVGAVLALVNPVVFALSAQTGNGLRAIAVMCGTFSLLAIPVLGSNAFGIRWRPGGLGVSTYEVTLPCGSARLAGLKVLVRSICVLVAQVAVGASVWLSMSVIAVGDHHEALKGYQPLRSWQEVIERAIGSLTGYERVALIFIAMSAIVIMVASWASLGVLIVRYRRQLGALGWVVLLHGGVLILLALTGYRGFASRAVWDYALKTLIWVTRWIDAPAIVLATCYVSWRAFSERLLTPRSMCVAVLASAVFGTSWVMLLRAAGVQLVEVSVTSACWMLSPALLPLMASVVAPWSLGRIRHV